MHCINVTAILFQSGKFDSDKVNKLGFNKLYRDYSSKMWENGKEILKYIIKRGGKTGYTAPGFSINGLKLESGTCF